MSALTLSKVFYDYKLGDRNVPALRGISLQIEKGEMVAIQGPSGSGKSTLLYLLGCMLEATSGAVQVLGFDVGSLNAGERAYFRNRELGFVFQQFHLLPSATVLENILTPTHYPLEDSSQPGPEDVARAEALAKRLGLEGRLHHMPHQLSGGQQQRVAIARALIREAPILLADEPTGNLDSENAREILELFKELNRSGKTVVIITHDREVAAACSRTIWIRDGQETEALQVKATTPKVFSKPGSRSAPWAKLFSESAPIAIENLKRNRLRSSLTMLGVVVGVASILAMLTLGSFTKKKILASYATLGINTLDFYANRAWRLKAADQPPVSFTSLNIERDVAPLKDVFPEIADITPVYQSYNLSAVYGGRAVESEVNALGIDGRGFEIAHRQLISGSRFNALQVKNHSQVCVIGHELAKRLFIDHKPIGETIQVAIDDNLFSCRVIGVEAKPSGERDRQGMEVVIPYTVFQSLPFYWYYQQLRRLWIEVKPGVNVETTGKKLQGYFKQRYGKSGEFEASSNTILIAQMRKFLNLFTLLLVSIAGLSLLVGGIGITNMMLVSVNERFREIGIRKALGASDAAIRQLLFSESLFLCGVSGLIGLVIGFASYETAIFIASRFVKDLSFEWVFNPLALTVSFAAIVLTGILSGFGPALKAEKLQVIEALRSE